MGWLLQHFRWRRFAPFLVWCIAVTLYAARGYTADVPALEGRVNDNARVLSGATRERLTNKLAAYERTTGHQLAILTVPTLDGDPIEDFGIRVVEAWKLGKKDRDDGLLLLVASGDKKMRIEVGYGLEGDLPDAAAGRIIREVMAPHFRRGDFDAGISAGVDAILAKTGGESLVGAEDSVGPGAKQRAVRQPKAAPQGALGWIGWILSTLFKLAFFGVFIVIVIILAFINMLGGGRRSRGFYVGGGGFGSGGGGGGFGGGGFGGGGGSFGGGGASGDW